MERWLPGGDEAEVRQRASESCAVKGKMHIGKVGR